MNSKTFNRIHLLLFFSFFSACENHPGHIRASGEYGKVASKVTDAINYEMNDK